jgi:hypothetical protein
MGGEGKGIKQHFNLWVFVDEKIASAYFPFEFYPIYIFS